MLKTYLAVMLGGALGTGLRMSISAGLATRYGMAFPVGTLVVNVTGSFIIGILGAMTVPGGLLRGSLLTQQVLIIGVIGGFTTFSAFSLQTLDLFMAGHWFRAVSNVFLSVGLCLLAVAFGHFVATSFQQR